MMGRAITWLLVAGAIALLTAGAIGQATPAQKGKCTA